MLYASARSIVAHFHGLVSGAPETLGLKTPFHATGLPRGG